VRAFEKINPSKPNNRNRDLDVGLTHPLYPLHLCQALRNRHLDVGLTHPLYPLHPCKTMRNGRLGVGFIACNVVASGGIKKPGIMCIPYRDMTNYIGDEPKFRTLRFASLDITPNVFLCGSPR